MGTNFRVAEKKQRRGLWPVYGLVMAVAAGAIGYVLAPQVLRWMRSRSPRFSIGNLTDQQVELLIAGIIFLVILSIIGLILAVFAPRKKSDVTDKQMAKDKERMEAADRARKKRQLQIQKKMREQNRRLE